MSEVRLVVRDAECDWSGTVHGGCADRAIAALAADPVTIEELSTAIGRFDASGRVLGSLRQGLNDEPYDAGLVVIDLIARLIVVDSSYSTPLMEGSEAYHDGDCCTDKWLNFHLAPDWKISSDGLHWKSLADDRRVENLARPPRDLRQVLYGRPLLEFIARGCFAAFGRRDEIAAAVRAERAKLAAQRAESARRNPAKDDDDWLAMIAAIHEAEPDLRTPAEIERDDYASLFYDTLKQIHIDWLMTPRDDIGGNHPREAMLEQHDHIVWDLQDQSQNWSTIHRQPPAISETSYAFRHAGFGTHEIVLYYDLVRELLWSCWKQLLQVIDAPDRPASSPMFAVGDFLAAEVPRLETVCQSWLDTPDPDLHMRTPRSVIHRERSRVPETVSGRDAMVDPDCPCCQMMADMPGPCFWHLDGCNMDDDFAFDFYCRTLEDREKKDREYAEFDRRYEAERAERERLGVSSRDQNDDLENGAWSRSYSIGDQANVPVGVRVFGIGCRLAEVIVGLRDGKERDSVEASRQHHIDQLNRGFGNLRDVLQNRDSSLSTSLLDPVVQRFIETLEDVAEFQMEVAEQCHSLADQLRSLKDPPPIAPDWESGDFDVPF